MQLTILCDPPILETGRFVFFYQVLYSLQLVSLQRETKAFDLKVVHFLIIKDTVSIKVRQFEYS